MVQESSSRLQELYERWMNKTATGKEITEFFSLLESIHAEKDLLPFMKQQWMAQGDDHTFSFEQQQQLGNMILEKYPLEEEKIIIPATHRIHFLKTAWFRYAAAVILVFGTAVYFWNARKEQAPTATTPVNRGQQQVLPGGYRAMLVLGDESVINLDTASTGALATQGETEVLKTASGEIRYASSGKKQSAIFYQKLITPKGGQYQVTLSDGTQAWLNAASSIRFPNIFTGARRVVEITGEVYFDVVKNNSQPFVVNTGKESITVLGTSFNVNSYTEEPDSKISLVTGAVKVAETILQPGQAYNRGKVQPTNLRQDIAWKNGVFDFSGTGVEAVMRQLARWYDLDIVYENNQAPQLKLQGSMSRDLPISGVLKGLAVVGVRCRLEDGGRLVVLAE